VHLLGILERDSIVIGRRPPIADCCRDEGNGWERLRRVPQRIIVDVAPLQVMLAAHLWAVGNEPRQLIDVRGPFRPMALECWLGIVCRQEFMQQLASNPTLFLTSRLRSSRKLSDRFLGRPGLP
jgi:hypothetical protein